MNPEPGSTSKLRLDETFESGRSRLVVGVFEDLEDAEEAVAALEHRGYERERISIFISEDTRERLATEQGLFVREGDRVITESDVVLEKKRKVLEGAGAGSAVGGSVGAVAALLAATGTAVAIPPLGIAVGGSVVAALTGAGAGGIAGGLVGALTGAGMSEYRANRFEEHLRKGNIGVGVVTRTEDEADGVESALTKHGGTLVQRK